MNALADYGRDMLGVALVLALPLGGAAVVAGLVSAALSQWTGLQDTGLALVLRTVAVAAAIVLAIPFALPAVIELTGDALAHLVALGQEGL